MDADVYYNENDQYAARWLEALAAASEIPLGCIDERSVADVRAADVLRFQQAHFFAGIGGWAHALQLARWPIERRVWTGSCPCQPFSRVARRRRGFTDPRHLWPAWFALISECRPDVVFGEQVASKDGLAWLDAVYTDLEAAGYAVGSVDLCAAGVGAPHVRQRLYFVADRNGAGLEVERQQSTRHECAAIERGREGGRAVGHANSAGREPRVAPAAPARHGHSTVATSGWGDAEWIGCRDGKRRPVEPGTFPLAHGIPDRVGRLRGYGNAIVPQVAAAFVEAYLECRE